MNRPATPPFAADLPSPVDHPSAWHAERWRTDRSWIRVIAPEERDELRGAVDHARKRGLDPLQHGREAFPLSDMALLLEDLLRELEGGRGFVLLRGLGLEHYDDAGIALLNAGIGVYFGRVIRQNSRGDRVGEVRDRGASYTRTGVRGHGSRDAIAPHCDSADLVSLLCVHPAERGGESCIASSTAIYNALLHRRPDLVRILARGFRINLAGKGPTGDPGELSRGRIPVFSLYQGLVSCRYNRKQIEDAAALLGVELDEHEREAVAQVGEMAMSDEFRLGMEFHRGDMQILNNHCILHSRRGFVDGASTDRQRLLLRTWVNMDAGRPLAPEFADRLNTGPRGEVAMLDAAR